MTLREIMRPVVMTIRGSHSCYEAALRMARANVHHLPVVDDHERLVGVISDRDLRSHLMVAMGIDDERRAVSTRNVLDDVAVSTVMTDAVITGHPEMSVGDGVRTMARYKLGSLPVVDDGRLVGIVTERDLLRRLRARAAPCGEAVDRVLLAA
jgi:CBS domain-containing protein